MWVPGEFWVRWISCYNLFGAWSQLAMNSSFSDPAHSDIHVQMQPHRSTNHVTLQLQFLLFFLRSHKQHTVKWTHISSERKSNYSMQTEYAKKKSKKQRSWPPRCLAKGLHPRPTKCQWADVKPKKTVNNHRQQYNTTTKFTSKQAQINPVGKDGKRIWTIFKKKIYSWMIL